MRWAPPADHLGAAGSARLHLLNFGAGVVAYPEPTPQFCNRFSFSTTLTSIFFISQRIDGSGTRFAHFVVAAAFAVSPPTRQPAWSALGCAET